MIINSDDHTVLLSYDIEDLITHENLTLQNKIKEKDKEIERLNNIIKEAKEYIEHNYSAIVGRIEKIYKILDKGE